MLTHVAGAVAAERMRQGLGVGDLGIDPELVSRVEAGTPGLTTTELESVARALQIDPIALRRGEIVGQPRPSIFLRHQPLQDFDDADAAVLDDALEHARARIALARSVGRDPGLVAQSGDRSQPVAADRPHAPALQGYELARRLRAESSLGNDRLGDVRLLTEATFGVTVLMRRLATLGATALSVKAGNAAAIVLAAGSGGTLVRVWIAHELCHVLFDPDVGGLHLAVDFAVHRRVAQAEQRARAFAAEFLVPSAGLEELLGPPRRTAAPDTARRFVECALEHFDATWQVTANQVCNHGFVDIGLRERLESMPPTIRAQGSSTTLPAVDGPSLQLEDLLGRAYEAGTVTDGEARALLGLDIVSPLP